MTTLKNSDREEVLRRASEAAFASRFAHVEALYKEHVEALLKREHQGFLELMGAPALRRYVAIKNVNALYIEIDTGKRYAAARPVWGKCLSYPKSTWADRGDGYINLKIDTIVPAIFGDVVTSRPEITDPYVAAWADYNAAIVKLSALLWGYTKREKFEADFPELAKYLPGVTPKRSLPAIVPNEIRTELKALGVK